jgi:hypothetical protein
MHTHVEFSEISVHVRDYDGALADRGRNSLHGVGPHVSHGENTREGRCVDRGESPGIPVSTNPFWSSIRTPRSHSVLGLAPIMTNTFPACRVSVTSPTPVDQVISRRIESPSRRTIADLVCSVIFGEKAILWIK